MEVLGKPVRASCGGLALVQGVPRNRSAPGLATLDIFENAKRQVEGVTALRARHPRLPVGARTIHEIA